MCPPSSWFSDIVSPTPSAIALASNEIHLGSPCRKPYLRARKPIHHAIRIRGQPSCWRNSLQDGKRYEPSRSFSFLRLALLVAQANNLVVVTPNRRDTSTEHRAGALDIIATAGTSIRGLVYRYRGLNIAQDFITRLKDRICTKVTFSAW